MRKPTAIGSQFFKYKNFISAELMAVVFAEYSIISVEVRSYGLSSDPNVFKCEKLLESNKLNIPDTGVVPSDAEGLSTPFVFVGEEAFALSEHLLRPYSNKTLTCLKRM
jgi:hypothetical protein